MAKRLHLGGRREAQEMTKIYCVARKVDVMGSRPLRKSQEGTRRLVEDLGNAVYYCVCSSHVVVHQVCELNVFIIWRDKKAEAQIT